MATRTPQTLRDGIPLPFDCTPFRGPKLTAKGKPFDPKPGKPGARIEWKDTVHTGQTFTGTVWDAAPVGWWAHLDGEPGTLVQVLPATKFQPMREADRIAYGNRAKAAA